jgi:MoaA/NifB/PqqE/SkfB family radical SAM enzyme
MGYKDWRNVIEEAASLGCSKVQFIGGEPTVHPRLSDLLVEARRIGFDFIEVYTGVGE